MKIQLNFKTISILLAVIAAVCLILYLSINITASGKQALSPDTSIKASSKLGHDVTFNAPGKNTVIRQDVLRDVSVVSTADTSSGKRSISSSGPVISHIPRRIRGFYFNEKGNEPSYREKVKAIHKLPNDLNEDERYALYEFLRSGANDKEGLHVKDEVMIRLERQRPLPAEFMDKLIDISLDSELDGGLRGYAMQHLRSAYRGANKLEREKLRQAYYQGLEDVSTDVAGTALLALTSLSESHDGFDRRRIQEAAFDIASDPDAQTASRVTAIQLCGKMHVSGALDMARSLVMEESGTSLRLAAIGTMGEMGTSEDLKLLEKIKEDKNQRILSTAVEVAQNKIKKRIHFD